MTTCQNLIKLIMQEIYKQTGCVREEKQKKNRRVVGGRVNRYLREKLARTRCARTLNGRPLKAGFYSFQMAVDLNATEGHSVKCSRIAPLPATEQRLRRAKRPIGCGGWRGRGC